eukprot:1178644-Pleurochrysis_carterae.AAC.1
MQSPVITHKYLPAMLLKINRLIAHNSVSKARAQMATTLYQILACQDKIRKAGTIRVPLWDKFWLAVLTMRRRSVLLLIMHGALPLSSACAWHARPSLREWGKAPELETRCPPPLDSVAYEGSLQVLVG